MLYSMPPFYDENIDTMFEFIKYEKVRFPKKSKNKISNEAIDLIEKVSEV